MNKTMKTLLSIVIASSFSAYANEQFVVIVDKKNDSFVEGDPYIEYRYDEWSEWSDSDAPYNCANWTPDPSTINEGVSFKQTGDCEQDQERSRDVYEIIGGAPEQYYDTEYEYQTIAVQSERNSVGTKIVRNMCVDILNRGDSTGNGVYTVDPDGDGSLPSRQAYCDMSNGGWTLYDSFGTHLIRTSSANPSAYNYNNIDSKSEISAAGYAYHFSSLNSSTYHRSAYYIQWFDSGAPIGWMKKTMPSWVQSVRVSVTNEWYGGTDTVRYGSDTRTVSPYQGHTYYDFNTGGNLELYMNENGILWTDSVWVK